MIPASTRETKWFADYLIGIVLLGWIALSTTQGPGNTPDVKKSVPPETAAEMALLETLLKGRTDDPAMLFSLALDEATIGENEKAIHLLQKMAEAHSGLDPKQPAGRPFKSLSQDARFLALIAQIEKDNPPVVTSTVAYVIHERDLAPEGIAYDPVERNFYVSSLHKSKVVRIASDGTAIDFKTSGQDGLGETLGMKVDAKRRLLWVVSDKFTAKPTPKFYLLLRPIKTARLSGSYAREGRILNAENKKG